MSTGERQSGRPNLYTSLAYHVRVDDPTPTIGFFRRRRGDFRISPLPEFLGRAVALADRLRDQDIRPDRPSLLIASSPEAMLLGYFATSLAGSPPAILPSRPAFDSSETNATRLAEHLHALGPEANVVVQANERGAIADAPGTPLLLEVDDISSVDPLAAIDAAASHGDGVAHYQFTSGSTGTERAVVVSHANVAANTRSCLARIQPTPGDTFVSWLPLYHDMGLVGMALNSLVSGSHLRLLSPFDFLADPTNWLHAISQSTGAISAAPNFAFDFCNRRVTDELSRSLDLRSWKRCYCGAEPIDAATLHRFMTRFQPRGFDSNAVTPTYGLAEATLMASMPEPDQPARYLSVRRGSFGLGQPVSTRGGHAIADFSTAVIDDDEAAVVALGPAGDGTSIELIDEDGRPITDDDRCGEVIVRGDSVSPGYLEPDGSLDEFTDARCPTGDVGFFHDGELYVVERIKNIIIRNGQNHSSAELERAIARHAGVDLENIAVIELDIADPRQGIAAVIELPRKADSAAIAATLVSGLSELDLPLDRALVVSRNSIPRTTSGKKRHGELRRRLNAHSIDILDDLPLRPLAESEAAKVIDIDLVDRNHLVMSTIERHARRRGWEGKLSKTDRFVQDLGFDSLALFELVMDVEETTGSAVDESRLSQILRVRDLLELIEHADASARPLATLVTELREELPQVWRRVDRQEGRQLLIDGRWITDFASLNYLGLDLHPEVQAAVPAMINEWGVHPSWTRAVASPAPYEELENGLAKLTGSQGVQVFPAISLLHIGVLPLLAGRGDTLIVDESAHNSIHEAVDLCRARGADVRSFRHTDLPSLDLALEGSRGRRIIAMNGVYSMTGIVPDLVSILEVAAEHDARVYVDDAHGIGILGKDPEPAMPYGHGGGGIGQHLSIDRERLIYVGGLSKSFSSMAAFVSVHDDEDRRLFEMASTAVFSGPIPTASLASALAGLRVNDLEGDDRRRLIHTLTAQVIEGARELGFTVDNPSAFPIVNVPIGGVSDVLTASRVMWEHRLIFTPSVFPAAPIDRGGFRISLTADNTESEVDQLLEGLAAVRRAVTIPEVFAPVAARPEI